MSIEFNTDVIVVGAGPSGISAAIEVARNGKKVVLIERAKYPGSKNMYGGAVYTTALKQIFKEDYASIVYERVINSHTWSFLNDTGSFDLTFSDKESESALAIKRFNLEKQMVELAKKEGVYFIPNTLVKELILKNNRVVGVKTELEDYFAPITILAEGVNSVLAKSIGLKEKYEPKDVILTAKIAVKLDKKTIEERFNLKSDGTDGVNKQFFGTDFLELKNYKNLFMMGFLYTFKDSVMLGIGANLKDLKESRLNINDALETFKKHPSIAPLIKDGETIEYSAHLIPETGYKKLPKLVSDGVIAVGDTIGVINSVHFEGTNFALISGKLAGESAVIALNNNNFSKAALSIYKKKLENSFILKDLYSYRNIVDELYKRRKSLSEYYPNKIKEFFEIIVSANCISKSKQFRNFAFSFIKDRKLSELVKDILAGLKCAINVFFGK